MNGLIMRFRMRSCLRKLEKLWYENNNIAVGKDALKFSDTKAKLKVLKALQAVGCVSFSYADNSNRPYIIRAGENSVLYVLERSELWFNRFVGFIAGILTTVVAQCIFRLLQDVFFQ